MARCLLCLLLLAVQAAAGSLQTGFAVRFKVHEDKIEVHARDRTDPGCDLNLKDTTVQLHEHDILVVSIVDHKSRLCVVNSTAFSHAFDLNNDAHFAQMALQGVPVNVTAVQHPFNISLACDNGHILTSVQVTTSSASESSFVECCTGNELQYEWCHRCGKGQYREGLQCHPCADGKTTPMTGVFAQDECICPEGYENITGQCEKCTEGKFSQILHRQNQGCQQCDHSPPLTGHRATVCPELAPDPTDTTVATYEATQYLRPRQKKCGQECCVPGEYWDAGLQQCQNCVDGYNYSDTRGATTCKDCGKPGDGEENIGCFDGPGETQPCKEGYYRSRLESNFFCTACAPRKTTRSTGSMDKSSCQCAKGYSDNDQGGCEACEAGWYKETIADTQCEQCTQHKTTRSTGSTTIMHCVCERGFYGADGNALCSRCERRQYQDELGRGQCKECELCPYGGYATGCGGANKGDCRDCTDDNCPGAADGERCDFCGYCNFNETYSRDILNRTRWFNATKDKCDVCGGNITEARGYEKCHKCPAGTTGEDGPRVCNETERGGDNDVLYEEITHASQCRVCEECREGTFKGTEGSATCQRCPIGKYANATGLTACYDCEANKTTASTGSIAVEYCHCEPGFYHNHTNATDDHQCFRCEPGTFSEALNHHVCNHCEAGKYNRHMVVDVSDRCLSCERHTWSEAGAAQCIECVHGITYDEQSASVTDCKCKPGYMNSSNGEGICMECPEGKYSEGYENNQCVSCPAGKASGATAATSNATCTSCDVGTSAPAGASACEPCAAGKYADARDTDECTRCLAGKYSTTFGANSSATCIDCPDDSSSPTGSGVVSDCVCNQGYSGSAGGQCAACEAGQYSSALDENNGRDCIDCARGKYSPTLAASDEDVCIDCARGKYSLTLAASDEDVCIDCARGKYSLALAASDEDVCIGCPVNSNSPVGSDALTDCKCNDGYSGSDGAACVVCAENTYSLYDSNTMQATCESCPSNSNSDIGSGRLLDCECNAGYSGLGGTSSICVPCVEGKYKPSDSGIACSDCLAGTYSDSPGAKTCTYCEQGKYSAAEGAAQCTSCSAGKTSPVRSVQESDCQNCPAGKFSDAGSACGDCTAGKYSAAGAAQCTSCSAGKTSPVRSVQESDCQNCPAGKFSDAGSACSDCTAGKYSTVAGAGVCTNCAAGKYSTSTGQTAESTCLVCSAGHISGLGASVCYICPEGAYTEGTDRISCVVCDNGWTTRERGSDSKDDCCIQSFLPADDPGYPGNCDDFSNSATPCDKCCSGWSRVGPGSYQYCVIL